MNQKTITTIEAHTRHIFALKGYDGLSIRTLSKESGIGLSSIYHFFEDKDVLLQYTFDRTNTGLGKQRLLLPPRKNATDMLRDRIAFQFSHAEDVVFVLKYYMHYRYTFLHSDTKVLPTKADLHIEEVLHKGIATGEFAVANNKIDSQAKIITHAINGFLLENYPYEPSLREKNIWSVTSRISLQNLYGTRR